MREVKEFVPTLYNLSYGEKKMSKELQETVRIGTGSAAQPMRQNNTVC